MDYLNRSPSSFLPPLWCLYISISLALLVCVNSNPDAAKHPPDEPLASLGQHVKTAGIPQSGQPGQPATAGGQPTNFVNSNSDAAKHPPDEPSASLGQHVKTAGIPQPGQPGQPAAAGDQPPASGTNFVNSNPDAAKHPPDEPSASLGQHVKTAGIPQPGQLGQPAVAGGQPPASRTNLHQPKTPPPPPEEYNKGEPHKMSEFFEQTFGDQRLQFFENGTTKLSMDQSSGSGFKSRNEYLFISMTIQMKLIPDNSAGAVTTFYLTSSGFGHDEIDIEFLGNTSGQPPTLHTNVYVDGTGNREQQFHLWFDPTADFHTYTLSWTAKRIAWFVDGIPIRQYKSDNANGVPYPSKKAQRVIASLWNADDWCTQGGKVKADWSKAPFVAYYRGFTAGLCQWQNGASACGVDTNPTDPNLSWLNEEFDQKAMEKLKWAQENLMIYNYCNDKGRFPQGPPKECTLNN